MGEYRVGTAGFFDEWRFFQCVEKADASQEKVKNEKRNKKEE